MTLPSNSMKLSAFFLLSASLAPAAYAGHGYGTPSAPSLVPQNAQAGNCYARVQIPAQYANSQETVMTDEGYSKLEVEQPRLASRQEQYVSKEASVRYEVKQPSFKTITEQRMVRPAYEKLSVSQPRFQTVTETVQTSAPRTVWKRGNPGALAAQGYTIVSVADAGIRGQGYRSTTQYGAQHAGGSSSQCGSACEIWCLVQEPGQSSSFTRRVMISPGDVKRHTVPAQYRTITKQVVSDPGGVREVPIPATYASLTVEDVVSPGSVREIAIPPKYGTVSRKHETSPERYEWRRVVCNPQSSGGSQSYGSSSSRYSSGTSYGQGGYTGGSSQSITYGSTHGSAYGSTGGSTYGTTHGTYGSSSQQGTTSYCPSNSGLNCGYKRH